MSDTSGGQGGPTVIANADPRAGAATAVRAAPAAPNRGFAILAVVLIVVAFVWLYANSMAAAASYDAALTEATKVPPGKQMEAIPFWCYGWGILAVVMLLAIASIVTTNGPTSLVRGADGRLSISKTQLVIWTSVIAYAYGTLMAARGFFAHDLSALSDIPGNVLIALGFSVTTTLGAKAIVTNKIATGQVQKLDVDQQASVATAAGGSTPDPQRGLSGLVSDDDHCPDLTKIQLLFWTAVAVVVYVAQTHDSLLHFFVSQVDKNHSNVAAFSQCAVDGVKALAGMKPDIRCLALPNIDSSLMVFMGLAHGTYLGGKLTQSDTPRIASVAPQAITVSTLASAPPTVTIGGQDLGKVGVVYLDGAPYWGLVPPVFNDSSVTFAWPSKDAAGNPWQAGRVVTIVIEAGGQKATTDAKITLAA